MYDANPVLSWGLGGWSSEFGVEKTKKLNNYKLKNFSILFPILRTPNSMMWCSYNYVEAKRTLYIFSTSDALIVTATP